MPLTKAEIARLYSLQEKKHREALGLFVVEGEKVVGELVAADFPFMEIYATEDWSGRANRPGERPVGRVPSPGEKLAGEDTRPTTIPRPIAMTVTPAEMARISHYPTPSSILAVGRVSRLPLAMGAINQGLTLALDGIQDPGNVGTLLRIADWFAIDRVLLSPDCADLFSQKVINASMGSFARVTVHTTPLNDALAGTTIPVLGCDLLGENVHCLSPLRDAVVVIGSEGRGLSPVLQPFITRHVTIPKFGGAESLNAAVAAAIVCDNLRRTAG